MLEKIMKKIENRENISLDELQMIEGDVTHQVSVDINESCVVSHKANITYLALVVNNSCHIKIDSSARSIMLNSNGEDLYSVELVNPVHNLRVYESVVEISGKVQYLGIFHSVIKKENITGIESLKCLADERPPLSLIKRIKKLTVIGTSDFVFKTFPNIEKFDFIGRENKAMELVVDSNCPFTLSLESIVNLKLKKGFCGSIMGLYGSSIYCSDDYTEQILKETRLDYYRKESSLLLDL